MILSFTKSTPNAIFWANVVLLEPVGPNIVTNSPGYIIDSFSTPKAFPKFIVLPLKSVVNLSCNSPCISSDDFISIR